MVTVECRKRKTKSDVQWIDELVGKREAIQADQTVAVCFKGLSGPALKKAKATGIEVRRVDEITPGEIASWCSIEEMTSVPVTIAGLKLHSFDDRLEYVNPSEYSDATTRAIASEGNKAPVVFVEGCYQAASFDNIIHNYEQAFGGTVESLAYGLEPNGNPELRVQHFKVDPEEHSVETKDGKRKIAVILIFMLVKAEVRRIGTATYFEYSNEGGSLARGVEFRLRVRMPWRRPSRRRPTAG